MSTSKPRARGARRARAQSVLRLVLTASQVTDLRRALMLAMHHVMAAKPEERSCAAMEAADYKLLDALVAGELTKQGLAFEPARASEEPA